MLATHQLEHVLGRERGRLVEVLVEAEGEPRLGCPGGGSCERRLVAELERQPHPLGRAFDCELRDLAVALARVAVAGREESTVDGDRPVEGRAGDELLAVDVAAGRTGRVRGMAPRPWRRHPEHAEERTQVDLPAVAAADAGSGSELVD